MSVICFVLVVQYRSHNETCVCLLAEAELCLAAKMAFLGMHLLFVMFTLCS
jgi:hypothetical protein